MLLLHRCGNDRLNVLTVLNCSNYSNSNTINKRIRFILPTMIINKRTLRTWLFLRPFNDQEH